MGLVRRTLLQMHLALPQHEPTSLGVNCRTSMGQNILSMTPGKQDVGF
jgi:hypothetical protein